MGLQYIQSFKITYFIAIQIETDAMAKHKACHKMSWNVKKCHKMSHFFKKFCKNMIKWHKNYKLSYNVTKWHSICHKNTIIWPKMSQKWHSCVTKYHKMSPKFSGVFRTCCRWRRSLWCHLCTAQHLWASSATPGSATCANSG